MLAIKNICLLLIGLIFLSGLYSYQATISSIGLNIYHLIAIFFLIFIADIFFNEPDQSLVLTKTTIVVSVYLVVLILYFIFSSYSSQVWQVFVATFTGVLFFASVYLIARDTRETLKKIFPILLLVSCFMQFYDFLNPGLLVPYWFAEANPGRAAGLFMNANQAGYALILFMSFILSFCSRRTIQICLIFFIPAIVITFSRSSWLLSIVMFFIYRKRLNISTLAISLSAIVIFFAIGINYFLNTDNLLDLNSAVFAFENILSRLDFAALFDDSTRSYTDDSRFQLIFYSLSEIEKNVFFGNGIGHTYIWDNDVGPHNMYLYFFVEFGLLGFIFYITVCMAFLYNSFAQNEESLRKFNFFIALFLIFGGLFSHTFFIDFQPVAILAIASALNSKVT
tara:strand:+ start:3284 stop:4468 length:1185 start_codon:yes stop_codon:yes gene_type:complete